MATGFGNWANSIAAHQVFKQIAQTEIERARPATRQAEVVSIDKGNKVVDVKFIGEQEAVTVPYTSTAPARAGQIVAVGGSVHDRHVVDVIGETDVDSRLSFAEEGLNTLMTTVAGNEWANKDPDVLGGELQDFFGNLLGGVEGLLPIQDFVNALLASLMTMNPAPLLAWIGTAPGAWLDNFEDFEFGLPDINFDDLLQALKGEYSGGDSVLAAIQQVARGFTSVLQGGPLINLGQLTTQPINLLPSGTFDTDTTVLLGEGWLHDPAVGRTSPGSARFDASGEAGVLYPPAPGEVEAGKKYTATVYVSWNGISGAGTDAFHPVVRWYDSGDAQIAETVMPTVSSPGVSSSGNWAKLELENMTAPSNARYGRVLFQVKAGINGQVWWDDAGLWAEQQTLPQTVIEGLADSLQAVIDWTQALVDSLLGALGIPAMGDLFDRITDLSDEIGSWFDDTEGLAGDFSNLVNGLLSNPASLLGDLPKSKITDLVGDLSNFTTMFSQFAGIANGDAITPINSVVQMFKDGWLGVGTQASDAAVNAVIDGLQGIGAFAAAIDAAVRALINSIIANIFGDGGTKWGQEVLVASGPVTTGPNDIPLGFGMPFSGKITDLSFYSSDHVSTGSGSKLTIEVRKNGTTIRTEDWTGGTNSKNVMGLNLSVAKYDRITFWVTTATSQAANMSVSVMGAYV